jgi:purine-nucleoside phosphorylase
MNENLFDHIQEAVHFIRTKTKELPAIAIVLGTGLNNLIDEVEISCAIDYHEIPHFAQSTVASHKGQLVFGTITGIPIVIMAGRLHYYEGYSMQQVSFPIRVLKFLGINTLFLSNVSGGVNADYNAGDIVVVKDHINLLPENPLRGFNDERIGPRFPDMLDAYDPELRTEAIKIAQTLRIPFHEGVYASLQGPNLETPAEYNFANKIGADLVGMSTIPEVLVARHMDMKVLVISIVSNKCFPLSSIQKTSLESVISVAQIAEPRLRSIFKALIKKIGK